MQSKKAFTIVELLVVMAVIGVLLSLAVFGIQALQKSQRETQRLNDVRNIQGSLESYYAKYKRYPLSSSSPSEIVFTSPNFIISNGATVFSTIPAQSLTPSVILVNYATGACTGAIPANGLAATADTWSLGYNTAAGNPQEYSLYGCTENGKTNNSGTRP